MTKTIYCCGCEADVSARLTTGGEVYPRRSDLRTLPFWKCDTCGNTVGCHHKTKNRTKPLGVIPTPELRRFRLMIHKWMDPIWKVAWMSRNEVYNTLSDELGCTYHTGNVKSVEMAKSVLRVVRRIRDNVGLMNPPGDLWRDEVNGDGYAKY